MPSFSSTRRVAHTARDMFDLVADIERYPDFVPLCEALSIRSRREKDGKTLLIADMTVGYRAIRETFTSQAVLKPDALEIDVSYVDGPFRYMNNVWRFVDCGQDCCDVHFHIDYEFRNRMLGALMGAMFDRAFRKFSEAFEARADAIYGTGERRAAQA